MSERTPDARERILRAAVRLLADGGRGAVTTRAVSAAAQVQPPTIYRQFGDMRGLLDAVARETLAAFVRGQATRELSEDPVEDLRHGWDMHVAFGLAHPDAAALIYAGPDAAVSPTVQEGYAVLTGSRLCASRRRADLRVDVDHALRVIDAAAMGVTLTLAATPHDERDARLSKTTREAILAAITTADPSETPRASARNRSGRGTGRGACRSLAHASPRGIRRSLPV